VALNTKNQIKIKSDLINRFTKREGLGP
jgi:hypothetical protein